MSNQPTTTTAAAAPVDEFAPTAPPTGEKTYFGEVTIVDHYDVALVKGVGKVVFDPLQHREDQKAKLIIITISCKDKQDAVYTVTQEAINSSKEWRKTYPSLAKIGATVPTLLGRWVQMKKAPTGETFVSKQTNETVNKTAFVFVEAYPDEETMKAAQEAFYAKFRQASGDGESEPQGATPRIQAVTQNVVGTPVEAPAPAIDRTTAAGFLPALWAAASQNKEKFYQSVRTNAMLAAHFDHVSPEMVPYLGEDYIPF